MTIPTPETPVGLLVTERPGRARLFERLGIDYCCHGRDTLGHACAAKGLDVADVLRTLSGEGPEGAGAENEEFDAAAATMSALADHIVAVHHIYLRRALPWLAGLLDKVVAAHGERHPELHAVREVFRRLREELEMHMLKEEKVLFPIIRQLETATTLPSLHCGTVHNPVVVMEHEHRDAGAALERLRALTHGYSAPPDACPTYRALLSELAALELDLHRHIHKENEILFSRAMAAEAALAGDAR
jgi:regulator of cell morphogenesis and NO signaling